MERIVIPAHRDHIDWLSRNMAQPEQDECSAMGLSPRGALEESLGLSAVSWAGMIMPDARPVCMWGLIPLGGLLSGTAAPWFTSTDELQRHRIYFARRNRQFLRKMLEIFPHLVDAVDVRHTRAIAWLTWMGFSVGPEVVKVSPHGMPFFKFEMRG